ncbi:hypothetical protein OC845_001653 [Tilletia horrida]|nr:hypothetical protein OC845_001653 [Tilletia horrida]
MPAPRGKVVVFLPPRGILTRRRRGAEADGKVGNSASSSSAEDVLESHFVTYHRLDRNQLPDEPVDPPRYTGFQGRSSNQTTTTLADETTRDGQDDEVGEEGTSLAPPPSFHFALNRITPVSELLTHPDRFVGGGDRDDPFSRIKVSLLVLVREVGPVEQYEVKNRNLGPGATSRWTVPQIGYRSHLIVCDQDGSLLKIMLWDHCAQIWADPADEEEAEIEQDEQSYSRANASRKSRGNKSGTDIINAASRAQELVATNASANESRDSEMSETLDITTDRSRRALPPPRSLRPGDVVYLSNIVPSRPKQRKAYHHPVAARAKSRNTEEGGTSASIQCSTSSDSTFQLCFRADVRSRSDEGYAYVGADRVIGGELEHLAGFDAHCRAILALARLWR